MNFFGIGLPEMAVIAAIGLLVFGPKRLPELGKTLGKTLRGFQSASQEFEKEFRQAVAPESESAASQPAITVPSPSPLSAGTRSDDIALASVPMAAADPPADPALGVNPAPTVGDVAGS
jgi:sec-independent protein translocase protein TatA